MNTDAYRTEGACLWRGSIGLRAGRAKSIDVRNARSPPILLISPPTELLRRHQRSAAAPGGANMAVDSASDSRSHLFRDFANKIAILRDSSALSRLLAVDGFLNAPTRSLQSISVGAEAVACSLRFTGLNRLFNSSAAAARSVGSQAWRSSISNRCHSSKLCRFASDSSTHSVNVVRSPLLSSRSRRTMLISAI